MQTQLMKVTGMTCGGCISNVTQALKAINGVGDVKVSLSDGEATVQYDERLTTSDTGLRGADLACLSAKRGEPAPLHRPRRY